MKIKEVLNQIEERFHEKLEEKTSWGRNELKAAYKSAVNDVLVDILAEKIEE